jgi:hypothetical protein
MLLNPTKYGLIVVAYIGSFIVVSKNWDMFRRKHFTLGVGHAISLRRGTDGHFQQSASITSLRTIPV